MTFIERLRKEILAQNVPYIFNIKDLIMFTKNELINISNYDYKNEGSSNKNKKILISRKINNQLYYTFKNLEDC